MQEFDIDDIVDDDVFVKPAEPVKSMLPPRNPIQSFTQPQSNGFTNPFANIWGQQSQPSESFTDDDLKEMADLETDSLLGDIALYFGLGKGALSAVIFTKEDKRKFNQEVLPGKLTGSEAQELHEFHDLADKLESTAFNPDEKRGFMYKVVLADMKRQRAAGVLKTHDPKYYIKQMVKSEFKSIVGHNPKIITAIGGKIFKGISGRFKF